MNLNPPSPSSCSRGSTAGSSLPPSLTGTLPPVFLWGSICSPATQRLRHAATSPLHILKRRHVNLLQVSLLSAGDLSSASRWGKTPSPLAPLPAEPKWSQTFPSSCTAKPHPPQHGMRFSKAPFTLPALPAFRRIHPFNPLKCQSSNGQQAHYRRRNPWQQHRHIPTVASGKR